METKWPAADTICLFTGDKGCLRMCSDIKQWTDNAIVYIVMLVFWCNFAHVTNGFLKGACAAQKQPILRVEQLCNQSESSMQTNISQQTAMVDALFT